MAQPVTDEDVAAGYRHELSILRAESSLTQTLDRPVSGRIFFEQVLQTTSTSAAPTRSG